MPEVSWNVSNRITPDKKNRKLTTQENIKKILSLYLLQEKSLQQLKQKNLLIRNQT